MSHDASKVLFGMVLKSFKVIDNKIGTILAGVAVRLKSDGTISSAAADGNLLGISCGKFGSDVSATSIVRSGLAVPLKLGAAFTPVLGAQVHLDNTSGLGVASGAGATGVNAVYASGLLTGMNEDGTTSPAALIDMQGGL